MIIFGKQVVLYAIERHPDQIETIFVAKELDKKLFSKLKSARKPIERLDFKKAQALSKNQNHQGMLARIHDRLFAGREEALSSDFAVMCVGLSDTGNIGAIVRTAYALGSQAVVISGVKSVNLEAVIRTSGGAALTMPICLMPNAFESVEMFAQRGFLTIGGSLRGCDPKLFTVEKRKKLLIVGAEDDGIPKRLEARLDVLLAIPMAHGFNSLNVSAAAAILIDRIR
ncbi:MAG: RNA methyltransferase [Helicobacteraceae bacterium]|nr:RNA methyltransferase [Helicobacteraceae bacterium]